MKLKDILKDLQVLSASAGMEREITGISYDSRLGLFVSTRSPVNAASGQVVSSQSVPAGTAANHGCIVEVTLIDENESLLGKY